MLTVFQFDCATFRHIKHLDMEGTIICRTAHRGVPAGGDKMQLEVDYISREWIIPLKGRTFYVNYTEQAQLLGGR